MFRITFTLVVNVGNNIFYSFHIEMFIAKKTEHHLNHFIEGRMENDLGT